MTLNLLDYRIRQRDYLLSIAQAMISRLNVRAVLRLILQAAVDMLQGQSGLIALYSEGEFAFWTSYGLPPAGRRLPAIGRGRTRRGQGGGFYHSRSG